MKAKAVRMHAAHDLRLDEFELPEIAGDEILVRVVSDSICHSTWKALEQGNSHKRVPDNIAEHPVIVGHEICGDILQVGSKLEGRYPEGARFTVQPAIAHPAVKDGFGAPGYTFEYFGGDTTYGIIPREVMEQDCLMPLADDVPYYAGSLCEPFACVAAAFRAAHRRVDEMHRYESGVKVGGTLALLGACGPMGLAAIEYALHGDFQPSRILVTDLDDSKIDHARAAYADDAKRLGIDLRFVNPKEGDEVVGKVFGWDSCDDVIVMVPFSPVFEQGLRLLAPGGCLNAFAGPSDKSASTTVNVYDLHYSEYNLFGSSASNAADLRHTIDLITKGRIDPAPMITHVGGLDSAADASERQTEIGGGKKLIYTHLEMELTALRDMPEAAEKGGIYAALAPVLEKNDFIWSPEAERVLLSHIESAG